MEITTKDVDSFFPYQMLWFLVSSPAQFEKVGKDWDKFASQPSGTGRSSSTSFQPRQRAEMVKNDGYWNPKRIPKVDKLVLVPLPEALNRTNALLSGRWTSSRRRRPTPCRKSRAAGSRSSTT